MTQRNDRVLKAGGTDHECGNFVLGGRYAGLTDGIASRALLREIEGYPRGGRSSVSRSWGNDDPYGDHRTSVYGVYSAGYGGYGGQSWGYDSRDCSRRYLENGMAAYIDSQKLEICTPAVLSAHDFVATLHAAYRIVAEAQAAANDKMPDGERIIVFFNNSDGRGNSRGTHINILLARTAWENIFNRRLHYLLFLASHLASAQVYAGSGKVGVENGAPDCDYQMSSRADFLTKLVDVGTMYDRPIVNSRFEPLCGSSDADAANLARLHTIAHDANMCHAANFLKFGCLQIVTAMIEGEWTDCVNLILSDPVDAVVRFSHDPTLEERAQTITGEWFTAVELQLRIYEEARKFASARGFEDTVPGWEDVLDLWESTLLLLEKGDYPSLSRRLDWVMKAQMILGIMERRPELTWDSPDIAYLASLYSSADRDEGLYWRYENAGLVDTIVSSDEIEHFTRFPPENTRAWGRSMLLRKADPSCVTDVDWDRIEFRVKGVGVWPVRRTLDLGGPLSFTKEQVGSVIEDSESLDDALDALGATTEESVWNSRQRSPSRALPSFRRDADDGLPPKDSSDDHWGRTGA